MAIEIKEKFEVNAPIEVVWRFVLDPHNVAACMPGAALEQVIDEKTFVGSIKVKVGAVMAGYKGRVELTEVDAVGYTVRMKAEGNESGGGTAKGLMVSKLATLSNGGTEVVAEASVDLTGKLMQVGRGMIQGVSKQLFQQFVTRARAQIEAMAAAEANAVAAAGATSGTSTSATTSSAPATPRASLPPPAKNDEAINAFALLFAALRQAIADFFKRLFGRGRAGERS